MKPAWELPRISAPSLERLEVVVPSAAPVTEAAIDARLQQLRREQAEVRPLDAGDLLAEGDEALLDVVGYARGRLLPFSVRAGVWMALSPDAALPGFTEALVGAAVGETAELRLRLPEAHPVPALRGQGAAFLVTVHAGRRPCLPPESAGSLEQARSAIAAALVEERASVQRLEEERAVLDALAAQVDVALPQALVDEELRRCWLSAEGRSLAALGFTDAERRESYESWRTDAATRAEVEKRLKIALALRAVVEAEGLKVTPARLRELVARSADAWGLEPAACLEALAGDRGPWVDVAWHLMAVEHVMQRVVVRSAPP